MLDIAFRVQHRAQARESTWLAHGFLSLKIDLQLLPRPILNRLRKVRCFNLVAVRQVHNRPREFQDAIVRALIIGELSLDGIVRHTNGVLPMAALARAQEFKTPFVPASDANEAALVPELDVYPIETLFALVMHLQGMQSIAPYRALDNFKPADTPTYATDFSEIRGQEHVKRALEVAAAGQHNVFMLWTTSHRI